MDAALTFSGTRTQLNSQTPLPVLPRPQSQPRQLYAADFLSQQLTPFQQQRFTGRLDITVGGQNWRLYLALGRFAWATGDGHAIRRWRRQMIRSGLFASASKIRPRQGDCFECWDYQALTILAQRQVASSEQAIAVIQGTVVEVLFEIVQAIELAGLNSRTAHRDRLPLSTSLATSANSELLELLPRLGVRPSNTDTGILPRTWTIESESTLQFTEITWQKWCKAGLILCSPNRAPVLSQPETLQRQTTAKTYKSLTEIINGKRSLRDIAVLIKKDVFALMRSLLPHIRQQTIGLAEIADLPLPTFARAAMPAPAEPRRVAKAPAVIAGADVCPSLVVCIDDNPQVCRQMTELLNRANQRVVTIQEAVQALPTLLTHKPDLIFLDLVMPIASGYEICTQIRRVAAFKETPIIILTGNDGIIDRVRAKMVGATDFLAKPIEQDKVLAAVAKYARGNLSATGI
ncbi:MAG: response regulator [Spirulinaceae cyanobacterium RM2_2_10]|nr:response regulator [Spirulinaceae cyanobacterium SM2_1_0]NJO20118.1 response regulator [Spirulinaceae cyanobacterium RM2_2_10]